MHNTITELAILLSATAVIGMIAKVLRQPMILAYLVVGGIISALKFFPISTSPLYTTFGDLGVTFLLFLIGLEINVTSLKKVGGASVVLGLGQIVVTFVGGFFIGLFLGLSTISAAYIAIALTFSSTVIVVKLLSEKQDMNSLYGKLSLGMLLVQDVVAILILVVLAGLHPGEAMTLAPVVLTVCEALLLFTFSYWLGRTILPMLFNTIARSEELLFITSLAWVLLMSAAVQRLGFSIEIGGFLAGLSLANSSTHYQIASRVKPLRDFFIALFFIVLGSTVVLANFWDVTTPVLVFSLFVLIGNPIIVLIIMGFMGYHRRTSFLTGITVAQISEFSLVLAALGLRLGHISSADVTIITAVGVVTIALSSYMVIYGDEIYRVITPVVAFFHRGHLPPEPMERSWLDKPVLLVGAHRIGRAIAERLIKRNLLILDSDPDVVADLQRKGYRTLYGDSSDVDLLGEIPFRHVKLVISTSPNLEDNVHLVAYTRRQPNAKKRKLIMRADNDFDAAALYKHGVDYVLQPQLSTGQYLGRMIRGDRTLKILDQLRTHDLSLAHRVQHE